MKNVQSTYLSSLDILLYDQAVTYLQREERGGSKENAETTTAVLPCRQKTSENTSRRSTKTAKAA